MSQTSFIIKRCEMAGVHAVTASTPHAFGRHCHDQFGIGLILRGAQKSMSGRGLVEAQAGDIITVNPGEMHDGAALDDTGRTWQMLYFDPVALTEPVLSLTDGRPTDTEFTSPVMREPKTADRFRAVFRALIDPGGGDSEIEASEHLTVLLAGLLGRAKAAAQGVPKGLLQARARIDDDPSAPASLDDLSVEFHPEVTHLGAVFPLRFDPCDPSPKAMRRGGHWSDHDGAFEPDPAYAAA